MAAIARVAILSSVLHIARAERDSLNLKDQVALRVEAAGMHRSAVELHLPGDNPRNKPRKYESYIMEMSRAIVLNKIEERRMRDYSMDEEVFDEGVILLHIVGTCNAAEMLCPIANKAVTIAVGSVHSLSMWAPEFISYWSYDGAKKNCTRSKHIKPKHECKNDDPNNSEALENLLKSGALEYRVDHVRKRAIITFDGEDLYVYLIYVSTWDVSIKRAQGTARGWFCYQQQYDDSERFFRLAFEASRKPGGKAEIRIHGAGIRMAGYWPTKDEVKA